MRKTVQKIPSLRIAITHLCNLKCPYCPKHGDSCLLRSDNLKSRDFIKITDGAYKSGIRSFSITGGEPLIAPKLLFFIAKHVKNYPDIEYLKLNTNGILLKKYAQKIKDAGFTQIKISLDSLKTGKYQNDTNAKKNA